MKAIKGLLYLSGLLFVASVVFVFLSWGALNTFMSRFGPVTFPDDPLVQYTVRNFFLVMFWFGALIILAVHEPGRHGKVLLLLGGTCLSAAVLCLVLGLTHGLPPFFYWDVISAAVIGALLLVYRAKTAAPA